MNQKVSIIVPVYDVESYIGSCINSLINQTYADIEIILIDDGSTDLSGDICDDFSKKDSRIKVIHKKNGGLSEARNVGIDCSDGEYILFVDSDDFISLELTNLLVADLKDNDCDIATCQYKIFQENNNPYENTMESSSELFSAEKALEVMLYQKNTTNSAWGKLYKKKLFDGIRFPVGHNYEDLATTYKLFSKSKKISINSSIGYYYRQRMTSIMNNNFDRKRLDGLKYAKEQLKYIENNHPGIIPAAENRLFMEAIYILIAMKQSNQKINHIENICYEMVYQYRLKVLFDKKSKMNVRKYALLSYLSLSLFVYFVALNYKRGLK